MTHRDERLTTSEIHMYSCNQATSKQREVSSNQELVTLPTHLPTRCHRPQFDVLQQHRPNRRTARPALFRNEQDTLDGTDSVAV